MGKSSKSQRTKGNTRPSSSGHTAELLNLSGKSLSSLIGFSGLGKETANYVPVTGHQPLDINDSSLDATCRMILRKMLKKDATSRLKAVQEFKEYCQENESEVVKNILPYWPRMFNKLALDIDRRIREATHDANAEVISKVKRDIAPYLKSLMAVWLLGQSDLYLPAASSAQKNFLNTFPSSKQSEALMFCKEEIFMYFKDVLFEQNAKSMSDPTSSNEEDIENKYILVISSSLRAIKLILNIVVPAEHTTLKDLILSIVSDNKFWKFAKNKSAQIRGSWYELVSSILCSALQDVFTDFKAKLGSTIFCSLSESDPIVAPSIWESALHMVVNYETCWNGIDVYKTVLPQLWTLLKEGGRGNASVLYPCLLPFLSKLPKDIFDKEDFLNQFFSCFRQSLEMDRIKASHSECNAIIKAFIECIQFIISTSVNIHNKDSTLLEKILFEQLLSLVEYSFASEGKFLSTSHFYPYLSCCLQMIEKKCNEYEDKEIAEMHTKVLKLFWEKILLVLKQIFHQDQDKQENTLKCLTHFFNSMYKPYEILSKKKNISVKFEDEYKNKNTYYMTSTCEKNLLQDINSYLFKYTLIFFKELILKLRTNLEIVYIKLVNVIVSSIQNIALFEEVLKLLNFTNNKEDKAHEFFNVIFCRSMLDNDLVIPHIIDTIFSVFSFTSKESTLEIFNYCSVIGNALFLKEMLNRSLALYKTNEIFQECLKNSALKETIILGIKKSTKIFLFDEIDVAEMEDLTTIEKEIFLEMLSLCLLENTGEGSLMYPDEIKMILDILKEYIKRFLYEIQQYSSTQVSLDYAYNLMTIILKQSKVCWKFDTMKEVLIILFHMTLKSQDFQLSEEIKNKMIMLWSTILKTSFQYNDESFNKKLLEVITDELHELVLNFKTMKESCQLLEHIKQLLSICNEALTFMEENSQLSFEDTALLEKILPSNDDWIQLKGDLSLNILPSFLDRKFFYPLPHDSQIPSQPEQVPYFIIVCEIVSDIIIHKINNINSPKNQQNLESYLINHLPYVLWAFNFCESYGYLENEETIEYSLASKLHKNCFKILSSLSLENIEFIIRQAFNCSLNKGYEGALPLQTIIGIVKTFHPKLIDILNEFMNEAYKLKTDQKFITFQVLIPLMPTGIKIIIFKSLMDDFIKNLEMPSTEFNIYGNMAEICCCIQENEILELAEENLKSIIKELSYSLGDSYWNLKALLHMLDLDRPALVMEAMFSSLMLIYIKHQKITEDVGFLLLDVHLESIAEMLLSSIKRGNNLEILKFGDLVALHQTISLLRLITLIIDDANEHFAELKLKWNNDYTSEINKNLLFLFLHLAEIADGFKPLPKTVEHLLSCIYEAIEFISPQLILDTFISHVSITIPLLKELDIKAFIINNHLLKMFTPYLTSHIRPLQFASHLIISKIIPFLPNLLENEIKNENNEEQDEIPIKLDKLTDLLKYTNHIMESMLLDIRIGDCCAILPYTDSYVYSLAYLLVWMEILEFISSSTARFRFGYIAYLEEEKLLSSLLSNLFRMMPEKPIQAFENRFSSNCSTKEKLKEIFKSSPVFSLEHCPSSKEIQAIACYVFYTSLKKIPASVRTWWNNLDNQSAELVNGFTSKYISGILSYDEIQAVSENENKFDSMTVRARPSSREVIALYYIDDVTIELGVQLPINYPLGPILAEQRGKCVIALPEWRHWLMQLKAVLSYQNGSILDGLLIWKKNLDKKFEGVEECMICYYVLHNSTLKLPKLSCGVCKKKFHSSCLYKWFQKSNNSSCPLCRNEAFNSSGQQNASKK